VRGIASKRCASDVFSGYILTARRNSEPSIWLKSTHLMTAAPSFDDNQTDNGLTMGVLINAKWEVFSQEVARGKPASEAYALAGFSPNRANATRLRLHDSIKARVAELLAFKKAAVEAEQLSAAERAGVDHYWVLRNLRINAIQAMRAGDRSAAARSLELVGKHLNMFSDKKDLHINVIDDSDEYLASLMELVNGKVVDHEPAVLQLEENGHKYG
jgi:hypothetical protein